MGVAANPPRALPAHAGAHWTRWRARSRWAAVAAFVFSAAPAQANGAMGLALSVFPLPAWFAYVVVTVLFEAALLGRLLRVEAPRALKTAIIANACTGFAGASVSGIFSYGVYGIFGTRLNPNPFAQTLFLFTVFGVVSSVIEALFWRKPARAAGRPSGRRLHAASLAVHLAVIPVGMAVLLIPARPYLGLEWQAGYQRSSFAGTDCVRDALETYVANHDRLPSAATYEALLDELQPVFVELSGGDRQHWKWGKYLGPERWTMAYVPCFGRLDTGEMRRQPVEWNPKAPKCRLSALPPGSWWLARRHFRGGWYEGIVLKTPDVRLERTTDPRQLGY